MPSAPQGLSIERPRPPCLSLAPQASEVPLVVAPPASNAAGRAEGGGISKSRHPHCLSRYAAAAHADSPRGAHRRSCRGTECPKIGAGGVRRDGISVRGLGSLCRTHSDLSDPTTTGIRDGRVHEGGTRPLRNHSAGLWTAHAPVALPTLLGGGKAWAVRLGEGGCALLTSGAAEVPISTSYALAPSAARSVSRAGE